MPLFAYDPDKSQANKVKHGIDFEQAHEFWNDENTITDKAKTVKGEERLYRTGSIEGKLWAYTEDRIRIISVRHPHRGEQVAYNH